MPTTEPSALSEGVRALLDLDRPSIPLLTLDDDEELTLGIPGWSLADASLAVDWEDLPPDVRRSRSDAAIRRLHADARMESAAPGSGDVGRFGAALALVDGLRRRAPVVVTTEVRSDEADPWRATAIQPLGFLAADEAEGLRAVLVELRGYARHVYRLTTPARAGEGYANWAFGALADEWLYSGPNASAAITLTRREAGSAVEMDRVLVELSGATMTTQVRRSTGPWAVGEVTIAELAEVVTAELHRAAALAVVQDGVDE